jgi:hypothetical protein
MSTEIKDPQQYNFIRAMIKIANPTWTPAQIEDAVQIRIKELENPQGGDCEMCSG